MSATIGQAVLVQVTVRYRPEDLGRLDPYWQPESLEAFSVELFGVGLAQLVGQPAAALLRDWRVEAYQAALVRAEQTGVAA